MNYGKVFSREKSLLNFLHSGLEKNDSYARVMSRFFTEHVIKINGKNT